MSSYSYEKEKAMSGNEKETTEKGVVTLESYEHGKDLTGRLGYTSELKKNRSLWTLLFQALSIQAVPFGIGSPLLSAVYGGGNLAIFLGLIAVILLDQCVALSLSELASRYPTSAGSHYWAYQLSNDKYKVLLSYVTGWVYLIGTWAITLSVNFGFTSLIAASVTLYKPDFVFEAWQILLIFYLVLAVTLFITATMNKFLPLLDTVCSTFTVITVIACLIALSVKAGAGRHSIEYALGHYDKTLSGWGNFTFFIGLLPAAYTFSAMGMICSMAEECQDADIRLPQALSLSVPVGGLFGLFFVLPICFTLPPLEDIVENSGQFSQALPYIFTRVMGSPGGGFALTFLVLVITFVCSISITVAASRQTYSFARDNGVPFSNLFKRVNKTLEVPLMSLILVTVVQILLGIIYIGNSSAFNGFVSVGVVALALSYAIPIAISMIGRRTLVAEARFNCGKPLGWTVNTISICWITFELVLFCMPTALPVTPITMNYASVVLVGLTLIPLVYYFVHGKKVYRPPISDY